MENYENAVFISYAWGGKSEEIVTQLCEYAAAIGAVLERLQNAGLYNYRRNPGECRY